MNLNELRDAVHRTAVEHGWWEGSEVGVEGDEASTVTVDRSFGELLMLVVSECAEALEEWRDGYEPAKPRWQVIKEALTHQPTAQLVGDLAGGPGLTLHIAGDHETHRIHLEMLDDRELLRQHGYAVKPLGIPSELADIIIRVLDICGRHGVDIDSAVGTKMEFNETRPMRHGGKRS